jgi:hypothetical protein
MLPGFRFLFSAIILSMSILVFGLGAAALLRAAHEEFASNPTWRAPPETVFAQQSAAPKTVLAALVVETPPAELKKPETLVTAAPEAPAAIAAPPAKPEQLVAPKSEEESEEASPREAAKSEPSAETPPASEPDPVRANAVTAAPVPATETKIAAIEATPPAASEAAPVADQQSSAPATTDADEASTKIATLGSPPVAAVPLPMAKPDRSAIKRRLRAKRARERRRLAQYRAMLAKQAAPQPATDLFGQIIPTTQVVQPIAPPKVRSPPAQAGPIAISGPSGRPHSAHDPS